MARISIAWSKLGGSDHPKRSHVLGVKTRASIPNFSRSVLRFISGDARHSLKNSQKTRSTVHPRPLPVQRSRFDNLIFMNSRITETSVVSCKSGNKNIIFFWILFCLLPKFLGTPFAFGDFLLIKAIDRRPSAVRVFKALGEITL